MLRQEFVDEAIDRVRWGLAVGELSDAVGEQLTDGLIDELLAGRRGEAQILGPGGLLGDLTRRLVERAMAAELTEHSGYEPHAEPPGGTGNARNGATPKTVLTDHGAVRIQTPRDRNGSFEPQIVPKGQRRLEGIDDKIVALYAGGMTTRDTSCECPVRPPRHARIRPRSDSEAPRLETLGARPEQASSAR